VGPPRSEEPEKEFGDRTNAVMNTMNRNFPLELPRRGEHQSSADRDLVEGRKAR
jgi:hypothetical protein